MRRKALKGILGIAGLLGALFLAYSLLGGEQPERPRRQAHEKSAPPIWSASAIFNGATSGQTSPFKVAHGPWRLRWETDGPPNSASLGFTVFSENQALPPILEKNGLPSRDSGTATFRQGGAFYILVSSYEANWKFIVESSNP